MSIRPPALDNRNGSPAERVLAHAQAGREVVQDFVPLSESLEWQLGSEYLRHRVLADHAGRYRVRLLDALRPEELLGDVMFGGQEAGSRSQEAGPVGQDSDPDRGQEAGDRSQEAGDGRGRLRAVFLNYLLD